MAGGATWLAAGLADGDGVVDRLHRTHESRRSENDEKFRNSIRRQRPGLHIFEDVAPVTREQFGMDGKGGGGILRGQGPSRC